MGSQDGAELELSVWQEAIVASVERVAVVGATTLDHTGVVCIESEEGVRELAHVQSAVSSGVIASHEEIHLLAGGEDADGGEALTELNDGNVTAVVDIKDLESISQVEVRLKGERDFLAFDVILNANQLTKAIDELILVSKVEDGLANGAGVAWERLRIAGGRRLAVGGGRAQRRAMSGGREGASGGGGAERALTTAFEQSSAVAFGRGSTLGSLSLLHHGAARWVGRSDELAELGVGELSVAISVNTSNDSQELGLAGVVTTGPQEGSEVECVDSTIVVLVNTTIGRQRGVVVAHLKLTLKDVKTTLQVDLLLKDVHHSPLDIEGEAVEATDAVRRSIECDIPQQVVRAGKQHLQEAATRESKLGERMKFIVEDKS